MQNENMNQNYMGNPAGNPYGQLLTQEQFYQQYSSKGTKGYVKACWILMFISAALALVLVFLGSIASIIDVILMGALGVVILKKPGKTVFLVTMILMILGCVLSIAGGGSATGIIPLICSAIAFTRYRKLDAAYAQYQTSGTFPEKPI
ncbi:MAG: hypothetical protein ACI3XW_01235 [Butyricicoccus sp.]